MLCLRQNANDKITVEVTINFGTVPFQQNNYQMNKTEINSLYQRDLQKVIDELTLFQDEVNIWKTCGSVKNSAGNLVLHLVGGLSYLIGNQLFQTGYVRERDAEFATKGVEKAQLIEKLNETKSLIDKAVSSMNEEQFDAAFPIFFDKENASTEYVLIQLLLHLNYHLGQINYLRRALE